MVWHSVDSEDVQSTSRRRLTNTEQHKTEFAEKMSGVEWSSETSRSKERDGEWGWQTRRQRCSSGHTCTRCLIRLVGL